MYKILNKHSACCCYSDGYYRHPGYVVTAVGRTKRRFKKLKFGNSRKKKAK